MKGASSDAPFFIGARMKPVISIQSLSKVFPKSFAQQNSLKHLFAQLARGKNVFKSSADFTAFKDVSFDLFPGESLGIIGRNGSGKSTLLKTIGGILYPTTGSVQISGTLSALIELGAGFHPDLSGLENIYLNGSLLGLERSDIDERLDEIIEFSELGSFIHEPIKHYSSGMVLRLGFAIAAHIKPEILIIDEILAVGDIKFQHKCYRKLWDMHVQGVTFLIVSHNIDMMEIFCDRVIWLDQGEIRMAGGKEVLREYKMANFFEENSAIQSSYTPTDQKDQDVIIHKASVLSNSKEECGLFQSGDAVSLKVDFEIKKSYKGIAFATSISKSDFAEISKIKSDAEFTADLEPGLHSVVLTYDKLPLGKGVYYLSFAVRDSKAVILDDFINCLSFYIEDDDPIHLFVKMSHSWLMDS